MLRSLVLAFLVLSLGSVGAWAQTGPVVKASIPVVGFGNVVVGAKSAPKTTKISILPPLAAAAPTIGWAPRSLAGAGRANFSLAPARRAAVALTPTTPQSVAITCLPTKLGRHVATFSPVFIGQHALDRTPLVETRCTGVGKLRNAANARVRLTTGTSNLDPINFGRVSLSSAQFARMMITNNHPFPIEVGAKWTRPRGRQHIDFQLTQSFTRPMLIGPGRSEFISLHFKPRRLGQHARTALVSWRKYTGSNPNGTSASTGTWTPSHFYVIGTGVE